MNLPVDFVSKAQESAKGGGYPVQISAGDLMQNFHAAVLEAVSSVDGQPQPFTSRQATVGPGMVQRQLMLNPPPPNDGQIYWFIFQGGSFAWLQLPALPDSGTHVLGAKDGTLQWVATEAC